jgi:hypothetical protein
VTLTTTAADLLSRRYRHVLAVMLGGWLAGLSVYGVSYVYAHTAVRAARQRAWVMWAKPEGVNPATLPELDRLALLDLVKAKRRPQVEVETVGTLPEARHQAKWNGDTWVDEKGTPLGPDGQAKAWASWRRKSEGGWTLPPGYSLKPNPGEKANGLTDFTGEPIAAGAKVGSAARTNLVRQFLRVKGGAHGAFVGEFEHATWGWLVLSGSNATWSDEPGIGAMSDDWWFVDPATGELTFRNLSEVKAEMEWSQTSVVLAVLLSLPWLWYFLLARLREVSDAVRVHGRD